MLFGSLEGSRYFCLVASDSWSEHVHGSWCLVAAASSAGRGVAPQDLRIEKPRSASRGYFLFLLDSQYPK